MFNKKKPNEYYATLDKIKTLMHENHISLNDLKGKGNVMVPVSIFKSNYSPLGCLCIYFKDKKGLTFSEVGKLLNRDARTIWLTYKKNKTIRTKLKEDFNLMIPTKIFSNRKLSVMENLTKELKDQKGFRFVDIAKYLGKSPKTIWCFYNRAKKK